MSDQDGAGSVYDQLLAQQQLMAQQLAQQQATGGSGTTAPPGASRAPFQYQPPNYQPLVASAGWGYDSLNDQIKDALLTYQRGAGIFGNNGGNNLPRYAFGNREGGPHPASSGFNASSFLAPYLAKMQGGGSPGAPVPGGGLLAGGGAGAAAPGGARGLLGGGDMQAFIAQMMANAPASGRTR